MRHAVQQYQRTPFYIGYMTDHEPDDTQIDEQAEHEAYLATPQGELETALRETEHYAQTLLKISDFTPEMFDKPYLASGVTFREAFIEMWRMVNWTKENLTGESFAGR